MKRVVITGLGVVSPVGNDVPTFWGNIKSGVCGISKISSFPIDDFVVQVAAEIKNFNAEAFGIDKSLVRRSDLFTQYALVAAKQAMEDSKLDMDPERLGVYVGSGVGGIHTFYAESQKLMEKGMGWVSPLFIPMMISNIASGNIAISHKAEGPCLPIVTACATGTHSIGEAYRAVKHGYADAIIAGGTEASITPLAIGGFANAKALSRSSDPLSASIPFDMRRQGFVIGEGAGILIVEEYEHAKARNAKIYAELCGYGNTCDAYHYTAPKPDASSAAKAMVLALHEANYKKEKDTIYINAHGTSTPLNDKTETLAIKLALGEDKAKQSLISSTKSMTGHMLGAAGAVELIATVLALKEELIPPTIGFKEADPECDLDYVPNQARKAKISLGLSNSLGFGGHNACLAVRKID
ncbi:MAG: beta-ketoacyl-ACP synthase II [Bacteroidales bacterium]|jgi:3-oxoacyl-[acyl-carrier-protein] synthase II|nr:beta-ketoacyl-ACP synthase II [Bacteroidales bacterium]MDD2687032.1 beta-ketoacyl-ACP synthase II [Bacteroidales bacterium]MDD3331348.1 beta-ketoacyl-ACP synthase II [Bacteroidales bacterium]MDD4045297.1 beta-ketoacyl-ACP synthase II [Bacteroidales bacterium]MDD4581968.1 beta-ketoacyl-ACP synthase II [Bacteroidales bacterium]